MVPRYCRLEEHEQRRLPLSRARPEPSRVDERAISYQVRLALVAAIRGVILGVKPMMNPDRDRRHQQEDAKANDQAMERLREQLRKQREPPQQPRRWWQFWRR